jgi:hypothetical protein
MQAIDQPGESAAAGMSYKVRYVLDENESRLQTGDVFGDRIKDTIVRIGGMLPPVDELAKPLAGRTGGEKFQFANVPALTGDSLVPRFRKEITA